jgi:hypothetical protein
MGILGAVTERAKSFLLFLFTAPYAASKIQPVSSGCIFEWRLAVTLHGFVMKRARSFLSFQFTNSYVITDIKIYDIPL